MNKQIQIDNILNNFEGKNPMYTFAKLLDYNQLQNAEKNE